MYKRHDYLISYKENKRYDFEIGPNLETTKQCLQDNLNCRNFQ